MWTADTQAFPGAGFKVSQTPSGAMTADTEELIRLTTELVRYRTHHDGPDRFHHPGEVADCLDHVRDWFGDVAVTVEHHGDRLGPGSETVGQKPSLLILPEGVQDPEILLHGHLDVVDPDSEDQWTAERDGDMLYGRGTMDMKAGCAVLMAVMRELASQEPVPDVGLLLVTDEEIGGFDGAGELVGDRLDPAFMLSAEPASREDGMQVAYQQKGVFHLEVTAHGTAGHGSQPWAGDNAADRLIAEYQRIREIIPEAEEGAWQTTCTLGVIDGGVKRTKIPAEARMALDIRYVPERPPEELLAELGELHGNEIDSDAAEELVERLSSDDISYAILEHEPVQYTDPQDPLLEALADAIEATTGEPPELVRKPGASDARYATETGAGGVTFGPRGQGIHGPDEAVDATSLLPVYDSLIKFVTEADL